MSREPLLFLSDIESACRRIVRYTGGLGRDEAFADGMRFDAVLHNLHVIGEAVKNLPEAYRESRPDVEWRKIAGMRDVVAHAYFALDLEILWDAVQNDVPALLSRVQMMIEAEGGSEPSE